MGTFKAMTRYVRVSPRKARLAAGLIRKLPVIDAEMQLKHCGLKGGRLLLKTLDSACANAEATSDVRRENLRVKEVRIDEGPRLKRSKSRSKGSQHPVIHRLSHFTIVLTTEEGA